MALFIHTADWGLREPADVPDFKIPVKWGLVLSEHVLALSLKPPGRSA